MIAQPQVAPQPNDPMLETRPHPGRFGGSTEISLPHLFDLWPWRHSADFRTLEAQTDDFKRRLARMLTPAENELLCRVGSGTPMGEMLRCYWIPAALSDELSRGGSSKQIRLLGHNLVARRNGDGRVFIADAEADEQPPRLAHYPLRESGGIVWVYLGEPGSLPPPLDFAWMERPDDHRWLGKMRAECNWIQCLEGVIDSAHVAYLHADLFQTTPESGRSTLAANGKISRPSLDGQPRIEVEDTSYGFRYAAIRRPVADADRLTYVRITPYIAPFYVLTPSSTTFTSMHIFVPIDDEHTMFYYAKTLHDKPADIESFRRAQAERSGMRPGVDFDERYRKRRTSENSWLQDRDAMLRGESSSGIDGVTMQDFCVTESMGPIADRSLEHLSASDAAVIRMRRIMLDSVRRFGARGEPPIGLRERVAYDEIHAEDGLVPIGASWRRAGALSLGQPA